MATAGPGCHRSGGKLPSLGRATGKEVSEQPYLVLCHVSASLGILRLGLRVCVRAGGTGRLALLGQQVSLVE